MIAKTKKIIASCVSVYLILPVLVLAFTSPDIQSAPTIAQILTNFLKWLLSIFGILAIIAFIISGILYLTSAGNENRIELAKKSMTYSILGVIVGLMGYIILQAVDKMLSGSSSQF